MSTGFRKLLPWLLGATLAIPVAAPAAVPLAALAQDSGCVAASPSPSPSPEPVLMPETTREDLFNAVWGAIDQGYLDPTFNGKDWNAIGDQYAPLFLQMEDAWQIYDLTAQMVEELGDDEVQFVNPLILENLPPEERDYVGIGALVDKSTTEDQGSGPRILYIFQGSGAEEAGLQPRDRIVSVDGDPCVTIRAIRGPEGTTVKLGVVRPGEGEKEIEVERRRIDPTVHPTWKTLGADGDIGYLRLPSMEGQNTLDGVQGALTDLKQQGVKALILDPRSVGLGGIGVTAGILAHVLDGAAGTFYSRADTTPLELPDSDLLDYYKDLPIVVLVDKDSIGEPERLAWILQSTGRAKIVGQETEGRTRVIQEIPYEDGSALDLVTIGLELPDGTKLEKQPVKPDVTIDDDWLEVPESADPYLLAAIDLLGGTPEASPSPSPTVEPSPSPTASPSPSPVPMVTMPDVVGQEEVDAAATLVAAGLTLGARTAAYDPTVPRGQVLSTDPVAGARVEPGTTVDMVVSEGPEPTPSPSPTLAPSPTPSPTASPQPTPEPTPKATKKPRKKK